MHRDKPLTPCSPLNTPRPVKASSLLFWGLEFNAHWSHLLTVTVSPDCDCVTETTSTSFVYLGQKGKPSGPLEEGSASVYS